MVRNKKADRDKPQAKLSPKPIQKEEKFGQLAPNPEEQSSA